MENEAIRKFYEVCENTYTKSFPYVKDKIKLVPYNDGFKIYVNGVWFVTVDEWETIERERLSTYVYCSIRLANTEEFRPL